MDKSMGLNEMAWDKRNCGEEDPNLNPGTLPIPQNPTEQEQLLKGSGGVYSEIVGKPREWFHGSKEKSLLRRVSCYS